MSTATNGSKISAWVETSNNNFEMIGMQTNHSASSSSSGVDITNKSLGGKTLILGGATAVNDTLSLDLLLSSDNVYLFLESAFNLSEFVSIIIKKNTETINPADRKIYFIKSLNKPASQDTAATVSMSLTAVDPSTKIATDP